MLYFSLFQTYIQKRILCIAAHNQSFIKYLAWGCFIIIKCYGIDVILYRITLGSFITWGNAYEAFVKLN